VHPSFCEEGAYEEVAVGAGPGGPAARCRAGPSLGLRRLWVRVRPVVRGLRRPGRDGVSAGLQDPGRGRHRQPDGDPRGRCAVRVLRVGAGHDQAEGQLRRIQDGRQEGSVRLLRNRPRHDQAEGQLVEYKTVAKVPYVYYESVPVTTKQKVNYVEYKTVAKKGSVRLLRNRPRHDQAESQLRRVQDGGEAGAVHLLRQRADH
jgi:hypothetical protein